jgi:RHS repeat-associated protein
MAMTSQLSENSHQGFEGIKAALCLAWMEAKSNTASGMPVCLWRNGIRSRSTGKERDPETGLDYFGARYMSAAQGRWTSPDWSSKPEPVPYATLDNPQSLNLYSYVLNNPLVNRDLDGHIIDDARLANNKEYQSWKAYYLEYAEAKNQWKALDDRKDLTVHILWNDKSFASVTRYNSWDDAGNLTEATVTLAKKTGDITNRLSPGAGYKYGSKINDSNPKRQAYIIAHELGHVEYMTKKQNLDIYRQDSMDMWYAYLLEIKYGPQVFKLPWLGALMDKIYMRGTQRELWADERAWNIVSSDIIK